ncbi:MAG: transcriptional repressor LexA [Pyrinomonadaceae bacterium]
MHTRTRRQHDVLKYIAKFVSERGYEPSYQQIARAIGVRSKGAVAKHIEALEKQGFLSRSHENGTFRISLTREDFESDLVSQIDWLEIPEEIEHTEIIEEWLEKSPPMIANNLLSFIPPQNLRAFPVPNDSMIDQQICEGDIAIIELRKFARDRECVVAVVDAKRIAFKKFYRQGPNIELRPANENYESIILPADKIEILGVFKGLIRPLS